MNRLNVANIALLFLLNSIGCKEQATNPPNIPDVIFPLNIGNTWSFQVASYDSAGNRYALQPLSIQLIADTTIQGQHCYVGLGILTNRSDGLYDYHAGADTPFVLLFKYPANPGETYPSFGTTTTVISTNDVVSLPAGKFACYHYRVMNANTDYQDFYLFPKVGIVKFETYVYLLGGRSYRSTIYELTSYHVH